MNLGQSILALGALVILGLLGLNTNKAIMSENSRVNSGESGIAAVSIAQSLTEEAMAKYFDASPETAVPGEITSTSSLTPVGSLGHGSGEGYRTGTSDFNDFDDYNNLFLVYKSDKAGDAATTPGADKEIIVPGIDTKYYVKVRVQYVKVNASNIPVADDTSTVPTWHKKMTVTVINLSRRASSESNAQDTLVYPAIMSYWR